MSQNQQDKNSIPTPAPEPAAPPAPPAPSELDTAKAKAAENWDKYLRAVADMDNLRKRLIREREEQTRAATERVITALLPALDNLERALDHSPEGTPLHDGLLQVQKQFARSLADFGLTEHIAKPGDPFDPNRHEAVTSVESPQHPEGAIIEQLQSAYTLGDRLLRPARVVVSKGAPPA
jgi:molecular chaperone GrpE